MDDAFYESWKRRRASLNVPANFADRVMAAIDRREAIPSRLVVFFQTRAARLTLCSLAAVAFVIRVVHVLALFLNPS